MYDASEIHRTCTFILHWLPVGFSLVLVLVEEEGPTRAVVFVFYCYNTDELQKRPLLGLASRIMF